MPRKKKLINNSDLPDHEIEAIARCIYPDILELFESEEGQKAFAEWKAQKEREEKSNEQKKIKESACKFPKVMLIWH